MQAQVTQYVNDVHTRKLIADVQRNPLNKKRSLEQREADEAMDTLQRVQEGPPHMIHSVAAASHQSGADLNMMFTMLLNKLDEQTTKNREREKSVMKFMLDTQEELRIIRAER